jgi:hypothetical protein
MKASRKYRFLYKTVIGNEEVMVMVFNATFNNISVTFVYHCGDIRTPELVYCVLIVFHCFLYLALYVHVHVLSQIIID